MIPTPPPALRRRRSVLVTLMLSAALTACGEDPFAPRATTSNIDTTVEVWALTGSPINYPTALVVPQRFTVRPDPSATFDLGFDIDADGKLLVLPVSAVVNPLGGSRSIGFFKPTVGYDLVTEAPRSGWIFDETQTYEVGDVFVVAITTQFCTFRVSNEVYAKYRVDSIFPAERRIRLSGRVNPNCGFRSFADGIPEF